VEQYPDRFTGLAVLPPPSEADPGDAVRRVRQEYGLRGVKVIPSWQGYRLDAPVFEPALELLVEYGMVLVPHTDHAFVPPDQGDPAGALHEVARRHPELRILAPHLGGLLCLYGLHAPVRPALQNMMFITTVPTTMKMVAFAVEAVGAERLAFGTDFPFNPSHDQRRIRRDFEALALTDEQKRMIAGPNVLRFLEADQ
jgi:predicted TIM-barrel fold metal-dependent hydrolase